MLEAHPSRLGSARPFYCTGKLYRHTNRVETRQTESILAGDSARENDEGKGEMVVNIDEEG
jgi:hypothetical protein